MKDMNKLKFAGVLLLGFLISLSSCNEKEKEQIAQQSATIESMKEEMLQRDSTYNELISMLTTVEDQVAEIAERENLAVQTSSEGRSEDQFIKELAMIDELVKQSNVTIQSLKGKLNKSNIKLKAFEKRINQLVSMLDEQKKSVSTLQAELKEKDAEIQFLTVQSDSIKTITLSQKEYIEKQSAEIEGLLNQNTDLNQVHYIVGEYQSLKEKGLVEKQGGFLWFGRTLNFNASANKEEFVKTDLREFSELRIEADKFRFVTEHPQESYEIVKDQENEEINYLKVIDPKKFWEVSKYLVVSIN